MKKIYKIILVIIWLLVIFFLSNCNGETSTNQSNIIVNIISSIFNIKNIELLTIIIRKLAHYLEYLILGVLVLNTYDKINYKAIILSLIFCIICAIFDEIHQLFIDGRVGQINDIIIDSIGSLSGIILLNSLIKRNK